MSFDEARAGRLGAQRAARALTLLCVVTTLPLAAACRAERTAAPLSSALSGATPRAASPPTAGKPAAVAAASKVEHLTVRVQAVWPHDPASFTQGLVWDGHDLLESIGQYGASALLRVELETGRALRRVDLDPKVFGEGLARAGDRLVQLTWREGRAFSYRASDFSPLAESRYEGEGWGLAFDGAHLWMSDGSDTLTVRDQMTLAVLERRKVTIDGRPRDYLNELEWVDGKLYANVWQSDDIVRIDPTTGRVEAVIDAAGLLTAEERAHTDVLNGIAYDPARRVFFLTGKLWPKLFEVTLEGAR
jgi:glutamine cyclotransferase